MAIVPIRKIKYSLKQFPFIVPPRLIYSCRVWIDTQNSKANNYKSARSSWYELAEKSESHVHPLPQTVQAPNKQAFDANMSYQTGDGYLHMVRNCFLYRHKGIVLTNFHSCFQEFTHHFNISSLARFFRKHPFYTYSKSYTEMQGTGAVLISPESHNYYHWMSDVLPRVKLYSKVFDQVDHFCVASSVPQKFLDVLPQFGIPKEKLLLVKDDEKLHFQNLFVASLPGSEGRAPKWAVDFVREKLMPKKKPAEPKRKIYFKRGTSVERKILNEDEVIGILTRQGFEIIEPDTLTIGEQAALMQETEIVVSAHGAALTNLLFASDKCSLIEIFTPDYFRTDCFYTLAGMLNINYWYILGTKPKGAAWGDIEVPEDVLINTLAKL
jgi:hypothetical protein